jgi:hypothetical protein
MREPVFNETVQLGIVVRDLEATVRRYVDDYGNAPDLALATLHICVTPVAECWCLERAGCDVCLWGDRWEN